MRDGYLFTAIIGAFVLLGIFTFSLIAISHSETKVVHVNQQPVTLASTSDKVKLPVYQKESEQPIGILIKTDDIDSVSSIIKSKGGSYSKHKIGKVIAANMPQNQIASLAQEQSITEILPNRVVQAFSVDVSEISPETFWNQGMTGKGITVAILDTGVNGNNVIASQDFTGSGNANDESGHGTNIAEVLTSVAPDVKIINAKVLDKNGFGSEATVIAGIEYAVEQHAQVISLSLGGLFSDMNSPMVAAVEDAIAHGVTVVVAAGNCGPVNTCDGFTGVTTPGNAPDAITVGAVNGEQEVSFSSGQDFGSYIKPDVVAPGIDIGTNKLSGTSIATPFASGAAALVIEKFNVQPSQVKAMLEQNAIDLGTKGKDTRFGSGKLNLAFVTETVPVVETVTPTQTATFSAPRQIQAMGIANPTTRAGDWQTYDAGLPAWITGMTIHADVYNKTVGFVFAGPYVIKLRSNLSESFYTYENYESGYDYTVNDLKIVDPTTIYLVSLDRIKKLVGNAWVKEQLPPHKNTTTFDGYITGGFSLKTIDFYNTLGLAGGTNITGQGIILKKNTSTGGWNLQTGSFYPIKKITIVNSTKALALAVKKSGKIPDQGFYVWTRNTGWSGYKNLTGSNHGELNDIKAISNAAWIVGNNGTIMYWNGTTFTNITSPTIRTLYSVSFSSPTLGYASGEGATILKYTGAWNVNSTGQVLISPTACYPVNGTCIPLNVINASFTDVSVLSSSIGYLFGNAGNQFISLRLQPGAPRLNVPKVDVAQNQSTTINLDVYSDGDSFTLDALDTLKCSLSNSQLTILASATIGLRSCKVTASKAGLSTTQVVPIEIHPAGPVADLAIEGSDIQIPDVNNVSITVHNIGRSAANNVAVKFIDLRDNKQNSEINITFSSILNGTSRTKSVIFGVSRGDTIVAIVDPNNKIVEYTEANNRAETRYKELDVYLNMSIQSALQAPIQDYLQRQLTKYNIVNTIGNADVILNIAYTSGDKIKGCQQGVVYYAGKAVNDVHTGLIFTVQSNGKTITNICGARIEGVVNAIRRLNKEDVSRPKEVFFDRNDLGAIATRDFMVNKIVNAELIKQTLNGGLSSEESFVNAGGTLLRLKHYKPAVSRSFLDYLFQLDSAKPWLAPVAMAGGLWSDITAWDNAGKEIAIGMDDGYISNSIQYAPRDVWLIELTGGPNTECDACNDYTYGDVYSKYWPALVGGVLKLTGRTQLDYVGHSNGGRVALDSLKNFTGGKLNAGTLADGSTSFDLPPNPVKTFIGVGIPGAFNGNNVFLDSIKARLGRVNNALTTQNVHHTTLGDLIKRGVLGINNEPRDDETKISFKLWKRYGDFINSTTDVQPGAGINLDKTLMIAGNLFVTHDEIVPVNDVDSIYSNMGVNVGGKKVLMHMVEDHLGMTDDKDIKKVVKEFLNDDPLTGKIENQVNG